jgi:MFS family permease
MHATTIQVLASAIFIIAIVHTFSSAFFEKLAAKSVAHKDLYHLLGEVEVVFGFWALVLMLLMGLVASDYRVPIEYLETRNFNDCLFLFAIMVVSASKPILSFASSLVAFFSRLINQLFKLNLSASIYFLTLSLVPILGAVITGPAAMTLAALLLKEKVFSQTKNTKLMYWTLAVLFVNISISGGITNFTPPVLLVAHGWAWDNVYMFHHFGIKALIAVVANALIVTSMFNKHLPNASISQSKNDVPAFVISVHLLFLISIVIFAHHPVVFMGLLLFFLGYTQAYAKHQSPLLLKQALMVSFFLGGLVVLGGLQEWWLQAVVQGMNEEWLFYGSVALTSIADNAAIAYLGSLVQGTTEAFKYALVAGVLAGGGLTVIANAPNPAGAALLKAHFPNGAISALSLLIAAFVPTLVAILAFQLL